MSEPDLVLHLGLPAADPVDVQRALAYLRPRLRQRGVGYLGDADLHGVADVADVVARARREAGGGPVLLCVGAILGADALGPVDQPVLRPGAESAVGGLVRACGARRVRVGLPIRRQDRLMEQAYIREVLAGRWHEFEEQFPYRQRPVLDFGELAHRLAAVPGVVEVVPRPAELARAGRSAFIDHLLGTVGVRGEPSVGDLDGWGAPQTCSTRGLQVALGLNRHLETAAERELTRGFVTTTFPADPGENHFLDDAARAEILEVHADANRRLFATYLPHLPADSYADDAATERLAATLTPWPVPPARRGVDSAVWPRVRKALARR